MSIPVVAIVGRPNVGKSSLLNRLARRRISIVDPTPGVTRDRVSAIIEIDPPTDTPKGTPTRLIELMDTGGYGVYVSEGGRYDDVGADLASLTPDIEAQILAAYAQATLILFLTDAQAGLTPLDHTIARLLREHGSGDRVLPVANKVDGESWEAHGFEMAGLGLGVPICISAQNGYGTRPLLEAVYAAASSADGESAVDAEMKLAIVGKRNAGKSTLLNALAGEPRVIVSEIAGTTRDSIDVQFEFDGRRLLAIDTAGMRKKKSFADDIEYYAYHRMLSAIRRADVVALLIDATRDVSQVDQKLSQELQRQYKPTVIVVNKIDQLDKKTIAPEDYLEYLTQELRGLDFAPIVFTSALKGENLEQIIDMAFNLHAQAQHREPTGALMRTIGDILKKRGPSSRLGTQAKLYYADQVTTQPPTILLRVNKPKLFKGSYERYLMNRLREELPYSEIPIRLVFAERDRKSMHQVRTEGWRRENLDVEAPDAPDAEFAE